MSQSDYIKYKKTINELKTRKLPAVLDSQDYTLFKTYSLETNIPNTKIESNQLVPAGRQVIFDMEMKTSTCPKFIMCTKTNTRPNRVLNNGLNSTGLPACILKPSKIEIIKSCTCKNGYVTNKYNCSQNICKCSTKIYDC